MNIYIELEVVKRELAGKLLVALELIKKNHSVYILDRDSLNNLIHKKKIQPGIIFLKDVNSQKNRINDYKVYLKNGFKLVSQDEEIGCFGVNTYKKFYEERLKKGLGLRYIEKFFCWGNLDFTFLKRTKYKNKIYNTGSPRIDIAQSKYTIQKNELLKKTILISLNHNIFWKRKLDERIHIEIEGIKNEINKLKKIKECYTVESKELIIFHNLFELIYKLNKIKKFNIIIRPHPGMELKEVKNFFKKYKLSKKINISSSGDIVDQIKNSNFLIHTGCTSSVEATLNYKNVITLCPQNSYLKDYRSKKFFLSLGKRFFNTNSLIKYLTSKNINKLNKNIISKDLKKIQKRVIIDKQSFKRVASKIHDIKLKNLTKENNDFNFYNFNNSYTKVKVKKLLKPFLKNKISNLENKFPPINKDEIINLARKICKEFDIKTSCKIKILNKRCLKITN